MKVRLGFAVAAQMEPDVLIIDEVLAVGDMGFVLKCFKTIDTILPRTAIIFVSHSMPMVSRICTQIILIENGMANFQGDDVAKGIDLYYTRFVINESSVVFDDGSVSLEKVQLLDHTTGESANQINWGEDLKIFLGINNKKLNYLPFITISIYDKEQRGVAFLYYDFKEKRIDKGIFYINFLHNKLQLSKGNYSLNLIVYENTKMINPLLRINNILSFQVLVEIETWPPFLLDTELNYSVKY